VDGTVSIIVASGFDLLLVTRSDAGRYFCLADQLHSPGYDLGWGETYTDVDTIAECDGGW
jgi:hypothetical protein